MIRRYRQSDLVELVRLGDTAVSPTRFQAFVERAYRNWVLVQDGRPVGFGTVTAVPGLTGLYQLHGGIAQSMRRRGLGSQLLAHIKTDLKHTAVEQISFVVSRRDSPAALFMQSNGFEVEHVELGMLCELANFEVKRVKTPREDVSISINRKQKIIELFSSLYDRCFEGLRWYQPYSEEEIQEIAQKEDQLFLLKDGSEVAGFAWIHHPDAETAEIEPIGILPVARGRGYGRYLLNHVLQTQKMSGKTAVSLGVWQANQAAVKLYQSVGFQEQSQTIFLQYEI